MKSNLPKIFLIAVIGVLIFPQVSFAAWWNPLSWFKKTTPTTQSISPSSQKQPTVEELSKKIEVLQKQIDDKNPKPSQIQKVAPKVIQKTPQSSPVSVPSPKINKLSNKEIISKVKPATVYISTSNGSGSGIITSFDGYVLTNAHVVSDQSTVTVTLSTGSAFDGVVVGRDEKVDLAIVKIVGQDFPMVEFGNSDIVEQGDEVFTLGYPFGLKGDVSFKEGTISRKIFSEDGVYLETSAEIHPGNSGGPLVDTRGKVIGINTASLGQNIKGVSVGETIKFAIPINIAKNLIPELKAGRQVILPRTEAPFEGNPFQSEDSGLKIAKCQAKRQQAYNAYVLAFETPFKNKLAEWTAQLKQDRDARIAGIYAMNERNQAACSSANFAPQAVPSCISDSTREFSSLMDSTIAATNEALARKKREFDNAQQAFINQTINPLVDREYLDCLNK